MGIGVSFTGHDGRKRRLDVNGAPAPGSPLDRMLGRAEAQPPLVPKLVPPQPKKQTLEQMDPERATVRVGPPPGCNDKDADGDMRVKSDGTGWRIPHLTRTYLEEDPKTGQVTLFEYQAEERKTPGGRTVGVTREDRRVVGSWMPGVKGSLHPYEVRNFGTSDDPVLAIYLPPDILHFRDEYIDVTTGLTAYSGAEEEDWYEAPASLGDTVWLHAKRVLKVNSDNEYDAKAYIDANENPTLEGSEDSESYWTNIRIAEIGDDGTIVQLVKSLVTISAGEYRVYNANGVNVETSGDFHLGQTTIEGDSSGGTVDFTVILLQDDVEVARGSGGWSLDAFAQEIKDYIIELLDDIISADNDEILEKAKVYSDEDSGIRVSKANSNTDASIPNGSQYIDLIGRNANDTYRLRTIKLHDENGAETEGHVLASQQFASKPIHIWPKGVQKITKGADAGGFSISVSTDSNGNCTIGLSGEPEEPEPQSGLVTGIALEWVEDQLVLKVSKTGQQAATSVNTGIYKSQVVMGMKYDENTHKFSQYRGNGLSVGPVNTGDLNGYTDSDVFTAEEHSPGENAV